MGAAPDTDFARFVERFLGEVPGGIAGDAEMRRRIGVPFMDTTDDDIRLEDLSDDQIEGWFSYVSWNLWDFIANRSTEGESGLIPRQQYETISFVQMWDRYPELLRRITEKLGVDGVVELGRTPHRELGSKVAVIRNYGAGVIPLLGRGITTKLGLERATDRREDVETIIQFGRRLAHGTWGGGSQFVSGRAWHQPLLADDVVSRLLADETRLDDPELRKLFRRFNSTTQLFTFLLLYDNRLGMSDTGPYPLGGAGTDSGFMIVRDHFVHETAYPWSDVAEGLPYCVTEAMMFRPDLDVEVEINDIGTTFSKPADYLRHLSGYAVYARDTVDTPADAVRLLEPDEMSRILERTRAAMQQLYGRISELSREEKIRNGVRVYTREMIMPHAHAAGLWDEFVDEGFDELTDLTEAAWPTLEGDEAAAVLAPVFLLGEGFPPLR